MTTQTLINRAEMRDAPAERGGRNRPMAAGGASSGTARREHCCPGTEKLMEAVVERENIGRNLTNFIEELTVTLRGWINYFRLSEVKGIFEELDGWIRRRLRCIIWRQWKRAYTRAKGLMKRGLGEGRAWESATNGRGPWWNCGASHMNQAFPKKFFDRQGLVPLLDSVLKFHCNS